MAHVIVLGAGVIGVTTAWQLQQAGFSVTVVDRQAAAALETSFANGGQISVSHATPWANPSTPKKALKWLWQEDAPLLFRLRADPALWQWTQQFLIECRDKQANLNLKYMVNLGLYSRQILQQVRKQTNIQYDCLTRGIMHFYTNEHEFNMAIAPTKQMQQLGCDRKIITRDEAITLEPALKSIQSQLVGATYTAQDESGDAHVFTQKLAELCQKQGVNFLFNHQIQKLCWQHHNHQPHITNIEIVNKQGESSSLTADYYVVCLGSYSPLLVKKLGFHLPIYPAKGYSATYPVLKPNKTPYVSLIDDEFKLVYSRLGHRLRVAGTAEFNGFNLQLNPVRCQAITRRVAQVFPEAVDLNSPNYWTGLRPMTPSNVPIIGWAKNKLGRWQNLLFNTGHGTLGWTHANGSAKAITDIMLGKRPDVDFNFVGLSSI